MKRAYTCWSQLIANARFRRRAFLLVAVVACLLSAPIVHAHPFHASLAQVEYNTKTKKLEVALRAYPEDLEHALTRRSKTRVDLDKTKNVDKLLTAYLKDQFRVRTSDGKQAPIKWVGKEVGPKAVWLYFEMPISGDPQKLRFSYELFFELQKDQVNTLNLKVGSTKRSTSFHARSKNSTKNDPADSR